jgi:hypothetical protein
MVVFLTWSSYLSIFMRWRRKKREEEVGKATSNACDCKFYG